MTNDELRAAVEILGARITSIDNTLRTITEVDADTEQRLYKRIEQELREQLNHEIGARNKANVTIADKIKEFERVLAERIDNIELGAATNMQRRGEMQSEIDHITNAIIVISEIIGPKTTAKVKAALQGEA